VFAGLFFWDQSQEARRVERRRAVRERQIALGDREVYTNDEGQRMSRLKEVRPSRGPRGAPGAGRRGGGVNGERLACQGQQAQYSSVQFGPSTHLTPPETARKPPETPGNPHKVDDEWILRRLERWGRRDGMPFLGPQKAGALKVLVAAKRPRVAVEVGAMAGYSAICIGQVGLSGGEGAVGMGGAWRGVPARHAVRGGAGQAQPTRAPGATMRPAPLAKPPAMPPSPNRPPT
jgi:hypothetical protein